jgi:hypothetical protein
MGLDLKLHDTVTGLKLFSTRIRNSGKASIRYSFEAPHTIPVELVPENQWDTRANVAAFARINRFLKDRIVFID